MAMARALPARPLEVMLRPERPVQQQLQKQQLQQIWQQQRQPIETVKKFDTTPAVVEVFSSTSRVWYVALVVADAENSLTLRFLDDNGRVCEKSVLREDPRIAPLGSRTGGSLPQGFHAVPSASRPGQLSWLEASTGTRYASAALAWQAFLEDRVLSQGAATNLASSEPCSASAPHVFSLPQQAAVQPAVWSQPSMAMQGATAQATVPQPDVLQPAAVQLEDAAHLIEDVTLPPGHRYISPPNALHVAAIPGKIPGICPSHATSRSAAWA